MQKINLTLLISYLLVLSSCELLGLGEITSEVKLKKEIISRWELIEICNENEEDCGPAGMYSYWEFNEDGTAASGNDDASYPGTYTISGNTMTMTRDWGDEVYDISIKGSSLKMWNDVRTYKFEKE